MCHALLWVLGRRRPKRHDHGSGGVYNPGCACGLVAEGVGEQGGRQPFIWSDTDLNEM